jgi:hypothetical protein
MKLILIAILFVAAAAPAFGQTYNSNTGGYNTGYGHMYGSLGMAMATQNLYNSMQIQMQRAMMREAMIKQFGKAAVEKAEREPAGSTASAIKVPPPRVVRNLGKFRPYAMVDTGKLLGDTLGSSPEEKALLKQIYTTVKGGYEKEVSAKGWQNNIAGALTFFIVSSATVYHDDPEPTDETVKALYEAINASIDEIPEFGKMPNKDKVAFNNLLVAFAAIPLATYAEGKQNGDAATVKTAGQLAGQLLQMILKTDPSKIRFENGTVRFGS